jgi:hypothetical protein
MADNITLIRRVARILELAASEQWMQLAEEAIELGLDAVPPETLRGYLTAGAAARVKAIADAAEDIEATEP